MTSAASSVGVVLIAIAAGAIACRPGDPVIDPKTPPNSAWPKIERPSDPAGSPQAPRDGG